MIPNLSAHYLGIELKNPIIAGSSGLTDSVEKIIELEKKGVGAVILKSIFEEEITLEYDSILKEAKEGGFGAENIDYLDRKIHQDNLNKYTKLISDAKNSVKIPIIASINCKSTHEWVYFAKKIEEAGADALELNVFILPSDPTMTSSVIEDIYFEIVKKVKSEVGLPLALKISPYFSSLASIIQKLSETEIEGLVLFNRFYRPDIDLENQRIITSNILSKPDEHSISLQWIGIMARKVKCDLAASTGIHDGKTVIKSLLAGADAVQVVSSIYLNGSAIIPDMLKELEKWMIGHRYETLDEFRGKLSLGYSKNPSAYERAQFMTYFGGYKEIE